MLRWADELIKRAQGKKRTHLWSERLLDSEIQPWCLLKDGPAVVEIAGVILVTSVASGHHGWNERRTMSKFTVIARRSGANPPGWIECLIVSGRWSAFEFDINRR